MAPSPSIGGMVQFHAIGGHVKKQSLGVRHGMVPKDSRRLLLSRDQDSREESYSRVLGVEHCGCNHAA